MDLEKIVEIRTTVAKAEQATLRSKYVEELRRLADRAAATADHTTGMLPPLEWLEASTTKLCELWNAYNKVEQARELMRHLVLAVRTEGRL